MLTRGSSGVPVRARVAAAGRKGAALSRTAAMMCTGAKFQRWVVSRIGAAPEGVSPSQAELDHNDTAATLFHEAVRKPFVKWSGIYG